MALGCHNIKKGRGYYSCANPDGDAPAAINVYTDTLKVINHTRSDFPDRADIITLVEYIKKVYFTKAIQWICEVCGYEYYVSNYKEEVVEDPCVAILDEIEPRDYDNEVPLRRLDESILKEYISLPNQWFLNEGISLFVQNLFEIGFSVRDSCITIPIRDELGGLVGVKARTILDHEKIKTSKYWFPYPAPKSQILYGLDKSYEYIKEAGEVIVYESEKSVQKSFSYGFCNCVSIGGHELSETQVLKLEKLGVKIILAYDKDVTAEEIERESSKFLLKDKIYKIFEYQKEGLLGEKDAPVDLGLDGFVQLYTKNKYKVFK